MSNGIQLLNIMREYASVDYQNRVPEATKTNIAEIGDIILSADFNDTYNEFIGIIQKIALTLFVSRAYENPLKRLTKGTLPIGATIEELAVEIAKGTAFDPTGTNNMARVLPHTIAYYHTHITEETYQVSISRYQIRTAFRNEGSLDRFIAEQVNSLYRGYEQDDFLKMKEAIGGEVLNAKPVVVAKPTNNETGKNFVKALRNTVQAMTYLNTEYSPIGFPFHTPVNRQVLLIDYKILSEISVEVLASAFNRADVDYQTAIIPIDDFGSLNNTLNGLTIPQGAYAILLDEEAPLFYGMDFFMERDHNGKGAFDTLSLHVRKNYGFSHIRDIAVFCENAPIELKTTDDTKSILLAGVNTSLNTNKYKNLLKTSAGDMAIYVYKDGELAVGTASLTITNNDGTTSTTTATILNGVISIADLTLTLANVSSITLTALS